MNDESPSLARSLRRDGRKHVLLGARLITRDGPSNVQVRDLSTEGVQVTKAKGLAVDSDVVFVRGQIFAAAAVVWVRGDSAGLRFYRHLAETELGFPL